MANYVCMYEVYHEVILISRIMNISPQSNLLHCFSGRDNNHLAHCIIISEQGISPNENKRTIRGVIKKITVIFKFRELRIFEFAFLSAMLAHISVVYVCR